MKHRTLIRESKAQLHAQPHILPVVLSAKIFSSGAQWMYGKLNEGESTRPVFYPSTGFEWYGIMKYGLSLAAFFLSAFLFYELNIFLTPLSIIVFYLVEVHFLFLFPLLIDQVPNPIAASIRMTYKVGLLKALLTVLPLGFYMMIGLLNLHAPLRNWYIGCMAVVIWYRDEVRHRL